MAVRLQQTRHLHGQGRTAGDDVAGVDELERRARQGERVDAPVAVEALVFIGLEHAPDSAAHLSGTWS